MAVFTNVSEVELSIWLREFSLGQLIEFQGIASGIENTNYFVTTSNGKFVLTLFEKLTERELPFYLNLMAHLARHGIPCPAPVANREDRYLGRIKSKPACIVSRLAGQSQMQPEVRHCATVGAMLGQMHIAGISFTEKMQNPRGEEWRTATASQVKQFLTSEEANILDNEIAFQASQRQNELPQGIIHADLFRDNVLFDGERIGGLIDFYFACSDALLYDVAITVNDWCVDGNGKLNHEKTQALLHAYDAVRPLEKNEQKMWLPTLRKAALRFWLSRLYDLHKPRDGELVHAHNPDQFKTILLHHIGSSEAIWL